MTVTVGPAAKVKSVADSVPLDHDGGDSLEDIQHLLGRFKGAIEAGSGDMATEFVAEGPFSAVVAGLCQMLQKACAGRTLPMEVGTIKILSDGRAKAVTYITEGRNRFVFTFVQENGNWRISQIENILLPLYSIPETPCEEILRIDDDQRAWISSEMEVVQISRIYDELKKGMGKEYAQHFFRDCPGYKVAVDAWLPFIEGAAQFILYTAVLETNLRGSRCIVTEADEKKATLVMRPMAHLEVLRRASFIPKIPEDEYRELFISIMEDRAKHCNLSLEIDFKETECSIVVEAE